MRHKQSAHRIKFVVRKRSRFCYLRIEKNEMGVACSTYGKEALEVKTDSMGGLDWTDLARDRDKWQARVNTMMNP